MIRLTMTLVTLFLVGWLVHRLFGWLSGRLQRKVRRAVVHAAAELRLAEEALVMAMQSDPDGVDSLLRDPYQFTDLRGVIVAEVRDEVARIRRKTKGPSNP